MAGPLTLAARQLVHPYDLQRTTCYVLFHVLYGHNVGMIVDFIYTSACRMYSITSCEELKTAVQEVLLKREELGIDRLRSMFFLLFNVDMQLKEYVCGTAQRELFAAALILSEEDAKKRPLSMVGTVCLTAQKARCFIVELKELINRWLSNQTLTCSDFVANVKKEYLVS